MIAKSEGERDTLKSCEPKGILTGFCNREKDMSLEFIVGNKENSGMGRLETLG